MLMETRKMVSSLDVFPTNLTDNRRNFCSATAARGYTPKMGNTLILHRRHLLAGAGALFHDRMFRNSGPAHSAAALCARKPQMGALDDAPQVKWALEVGPGRHRRSLDSRRIAL